MFTDPVVPVEVFFYWPEAVFGRNFYWPGAIGSPLASSPDHSQNFFVIHLLSLRNKEKKE